MSQTQVLEPFICQQGISGRLPAILLERNKHNPQVIFKSLCRTLKVKYTKIVSSRFYDSFWLLYFPLLSILPHDDGSKNLLVYNNNFAVYLQVGGLWVLQKSKAGSLQLIWNPKVELEMILKLTCPKKEKVRKPDALSGTFLHSNIVQQGSVKIYYCDPELFDYKNGAHKEYKKYSFFELYRKI